MGNSIEELNTTSVGYEINFGYPLINTLEKKCFKIINTSSSSTYKFEFPSYDKLLFIPAIGHLKPNATKEVIVTFLSKEPFTIAKVNYIVFVKITTLKNCYFVIKTHKIFCIFFTGSVEMYILSNRI